jgi:signal transduction histidine kinase/CheY-like chemotaxis protein
MNRNQYHNRSGDPRPRRVAVHFDSALPKAIMVCVAGTDPRNNSKRRLMRRISELTTEIARCKLAEHELETARDAAERASRAKDDFLAALSHELRTPLTPVLLIASDAAANKELGASVRTDFETIARNVATETRLIDDLLDMSRITHGKLSLDKKPADVHAILRDAINTIESKAGLKRIMEGCQLKAEHSTVLGDPVRLQQIFWNVLKNAAKFTPDSGEISVTTKCSDNKKEILITVSDSGLGMTPAELGTVFDAFQQGEHATNADCSGRHFGGLGLGLAITQKLVGLHAGTIHASSAGRNAGSTFLISLPLTPATTAEKPARAAHSGHVTMNGNRPNATPRASGVRVLLVEDHAPTRNALTTLLMRRSFHVESAGSLAEARVLAGKNEYQLLISDIGLPDGDGYELMTELGSARVKGIALTGYGMEDDVAFSQSAGFVAHLTKPVSIKSLESALAAALAL